MRYRPAINRPGRNLPSTTAYSGNAEDREDDARDPDEGGRGGSGELTVAKSSVATSSRFVTVGTLSVFGIGLPHDEQKRTFTGSFAPQEVQTAMISPQQSTASTQLFGCRRRLAHRFLLVEGQPHGREQ